MGKKGLAGICVHLRITSYRGSPYLLRPAPAGLKSDRTEPSRENGDSPSTKALPICVHLRQLRMISGGPARDVPLI